MSDLFSGSSTKKTAATEDYSAKDIEVLEGLEPVRLRPGMYIGGKDEIAMHHLVNEVFDNSMDEAVAGHATRIEINVAEDNVITIRDNGRGIPIDPHPKFKKKTALEVILTTLHAGGKFSDKAYSTAGGLHGVGISVVNALSDKLEVEVVRDQTVYRQEYVRGIPQGKLKKAGHIKNRKGTSITFHPDVEIFGSRAKFRPERLYKFVRSKAYLFRGVEIRWKCAPSLLSTAKDIPEEETIHFPGGLQDFILQQLGGRAQLTANAFFGEAPLADKMGKIEWAIAWPIDEDGFANYYCNTIPTPDGGTHETGLRAALTKGLRQFGEITKNKKAEKITADDIMGGATIILSLFIKDPQFQGQTKEKLVSLEANKLVENAVRDHFDNWLSADPDSAHKLLAYIINRVEERLKRRQEKQINRKAVTTRLRLPGKLADCTRTDSKGTELFLVEGDSAGGSAKQGRFREFQAILPLRGKILNVASATKDKINANQEISDIILALGCGSGKHFDRKALRYDKIIIMCDADVDGAHIASLLMTFFYLEMPEIVRGEHLYIAQPPLFRLTQANKAYYAADEAEKEVLMEKLSKGKGKIDVGRFKGLGEMTPPQLKETTMDPANRTLLRVVVDAEETEQTDERVEHLMGKKPELRFRFIKEQTELYGERIAEAIDV